MAKLSYEKALEQLEKEKTILAGLQERRSKIDDKIKECEQSISECEQVINQFKYVQANTIFNAKGVSIEDIMNAFQSGDLSSIQDKLVHTKTDDSDSAVSEVPE